MLIGLAFLACFRERKSALKLDTAAYRKRQERKGRTEHN